MHVPVVAVAVEVIHHTTTVTQEKEDNASNSLLRKVENM